MGSSGKWLLLLVSLFSINSIRAEAEADYITVKSTPFLKSILQRSGSVCPMVNFEQPFGEVSIPFSEQRAQMLFKTPKYTYIFIPNTGRLYRLVNPMDTLYRFVRMDKTVAMFYNIGCYLFTIDEDIYTFGGYGFWKSNGILRKFNFKDREWDVVPLSDEIIAQTNPSKVLWYDIRKRVLMVPFQHVLNDGIRLKDFKNKKFNPDAYTLNLADGEWKRIGRASQRFVELFYNFAPSSTIEDEHGQLVLGGNYIYWLDYSHNRVMTLTDDALRQSIIRLLYHKERHQYMKDRKIYSYDYALQRMDSISLDIDKFNGETFPIWYNPFSEYLWAGVPFLFLTGGLFFYYRRHRSRPRSGPHPHQPNDQRLIFTESERGLLRLLLEKAGEDRSVTIEEINYVLGLKEKNLGLQKKVRSDIINSINQKFTLATQEPEFLIQSVRSEFDKRYFEYYINSDYRGLLKQLLQDKVD